MQKIFLKFQYKRARNVINQKRHIIILKIFTNNLLDLINLELNDKYIDNRKFNIKRYKYDGNILFGLHDKEFDEETLKKDNGNNNNTELSESKVD